MSINDVDIRQSILQLVRKPASVNYNPKSLREPGNISEYRTKFLECREQFEHPPPPIQKVPFIPHWVKPKYDTYLPITYKKRGDVITDVRIKFSENYGENDDKIGSRMEFDNPAYSIMNAETMTNEDLRSNENPILLVPPGIQAASRSTDDNYSTRTLEEKVKRRMDRHNRHMRSIKRFQPLGIGEERKERSSSMPSVNESSSASNRIVDTSMKNPSRLANDPATTYKQIVYRPIVRKAIELKKYDHIVTNVIRSEK